MKKNTLKFKENTILCDRCVINAAKALSQIPSVKEFSVDINTKVIQVIYKDDNIPKELIRNVINHSIISGKTEAILH